MMTVVVEWRRPVSQSTRLRTLKKDMLKYSRQRKRWEDNKEWTGLEWNIILRKAETAREGMLVVKSTVVLQRSARLRGPYAPQGRTSLLPKLSVTSKVSARTSYAWVGSRVQFRSSEDVDLLEFTSPVDREYMRRCWKFHWI